MTEDASHARIACLGKDHPGPLILIDGTVIGLTVERLPGKPKPKPMWLWASKSVPESETQADHWWSMYLRRFDIEHTFRFLKQSIGRAMPRLRQSDATDRCTWLTLGAQTLLRLARRLAVASRLP